MLRLEALGFDECHLGAGGDVHHGVVFTVLWAGINNNQRLSSLSLQCRLVHLHVEDCSEELLPQQSYAIKNQLGHPKPPTRSFGTQNTPNPELLAQATLGKLSTNESAVM